MTEYPFTIRDAAEGDLSRLIDLYAQLSLDEPREDPGPPLPERYAGVFQEVAADPRQRLLVAERDGRLVGSLTLIIVPNLTHRGSPYAIVENVVVDKPERGSGAGDALMSRAVQLAREAGCYKASLTSNKLREDAHRFYRRLGFKATHEGFRIEL